MCAASPTGFHCFKPIVGGKEKQPCCLCSMMDSCLFIMNARHSALPDRGNKGEQRPSSVLILLNRAPPSSEVIAEHGCIRVKFTPVNTTSLLQPIDQGITAVCKKLYCRLMEGVMVVEWGWSECGEGNSSELEKIQPTLSHLHHLLGTAWCVYIDPG